MKYRLVIILFAGILGPVFGEAATCADFFNPLVNFYSSSPRCLNLEVDGETVGVVSNSDVVKTQGPNQGETCFRFTFTVRAGLGIRRAKVGLWLRDIPSDNSRFTRKRRFLDSEPTMVRVDACLDDIPTEGDCCGGETTTPLLVGEARVRMEDGKVRTASLVGTSVNPVRAQVTNSPTATSSTTCAPPSTQSVCETVAGVDFLACQFRFSCGGIGGRPQFTGINRIDLDAGTVQLVVSPGGEIEPERFELTIYEPPQPSPGAPILADAVTVVRRPAVSIQSVASVSVATFFVPELPQLEAVALAVEFIPIDLSDQRYSVRASAQQRVSLEFISFSFDVVIANDGPLPLGQIAADSLFGPLPRNGVVGRIGSVICGYCLPPEAPARGEWEILDPGQPVGLNVRQFEAIEARLPSNCVYEGQIETLGSQCGPNGAPGVLRFLDVVQGQVVCECQPLPM